MRSFFCFKKEQAMNPENFNLPNNTVSQYILSHLNTATLKRGWMTTNELAYVLGCTPKTITRWRKANKLTPKCFSIGKYCYFIQDVYEFFINSRIN